MGAARRRISATIALLVLVAALGNGWVGVAAQGSAPPTCRARCGRCLPCRPVHVAIQPGVSFPLEYYPVAWRCKCGNQLFMP